MRATVPLWTAAIKVHCGNTTLNGFAVRFEGPIRWNNDVSWGPAVIGMTDNFDQGHDERKVNVAFTRLDLEIPPVENPAAGSMRCGSMRLIRAKSGVIEGNCPARRPDRVLRRAVADRRQRLSTALRPARFRTESSAGHGTHDILVRGNRTRTVDPSGKTWRFLVLTWCSANDVIERNTIEHLAERDDDTIPWSNEPEIILTEAYHLKYEGKVMALSKDGRLLRTGRCHGLPVRTGDVVSLLNGPAPASGGGSSRRSIRPPIWSIRRSRRGRKSYRSPPGFVGEVFQENRIDVRGAAVDCLVLVGNHFGTRVIKNHFLGGGARFG